eukprot:1154155-Rhodomonas_salina.1
MSTPPATPLNEEAAPSDKGNTAIVHEAAYKEGQVAKKQGGMGFWWALVMISAVYMAMLGASVLYVTNVSKTPSQVEMIRRVYRSASLSTTCRARLCLRVWRRFWWRSSGWGFWQARAISAGIKIAGRWCGGFWGSHRQEFCGEGMGDGTAVREVRR